MLEKADALSACDDPQKAHKALVGPLRGYHGITYGRYRAIYRTEEEKLSGGDVWVHIVVCFVAAGIRREGDKTDIYALALRLARLGLLHGEKRADQDSS